MYFANINGGGIYSLKSKVIAIFLCLFLGCLGAYRFYVGKFSTGVIWFLTLGWFGVGVLIDLVAIMIGSFIDINGQLLL